MAGLRKKISTLSPRDSPRPSSELKRSATPSEASSRATSDDEHGSTLPQFLLRVTAGPSYDESTHRIVHVNGDNAIEIENEFMVTRLKVRVRGFKGIPRSTPSTSPYFATSQHSNDQYSLAFTFTPKQDIPSVDLIWGNDFDHPVRDKLPPGFNTAFKIVKQFIDPGLECDAYSDEPWLYGPALSCWFAFRIGDMDKGLVNQPLRTAEEEDVLEEGADGSGIKIRQQLSIPAAPEKRRKFFLDKSHREAFHFEKGRMYKADFFNPYLDFGKYALRLPGFSLSVVKYIGKKTHMLRYVFKNRSTGDVFFVVCLTLLHGEDLLRAVEDDARSRSPHDSDVD